MTGDNRARVKKRRNRVAVSCSSCRTLKTKCDGGRPECSTCIRYNRDCEYEQHGTARSAAAPAAKIHHEYVRTLEKRVEDLERRLSAASSDRAITPAASYPPILPLAEPSDNPDLRFETDSRSERCSEPPRLPHRTPSASVTIDANVSIGGVGLPQLIINVFGGHGDVKAESMMTDREIRANRSLLLGEDLYSLPDNALQILERFFLFRNPLTPLFHIPTIRPVFHAALCCPREERHQHQPALILLNMICAFCTLHWHVDTEPNAPTARKHYDIAMALVQPTLLGDWSLEHVQALLIGARYLQGSNCANECWNILGLAIRIAFGLRLHQEPPATDPPPLRETKRRTWYAAYILDMHWSMIYQRPSAIKSTDFSVHPPEDLDDDCIREDGLLYPSPQRPSVNMSFFLQVIQLYRIVEGAISRLSGGVSGSREIVEFATTFDEDYQKWHRELPGHLRFDIENMKQEPQELIQEPPWILALRGNMVRVLIHQYSLQWSLHQLTNPDRAHESMITHALQHSKNLCIAAATETIEIVALRHEVTKQTMGLDWYNVYYLFNSIIVLVSHIVDPTNTQDKSYLAHLDKALGMLKSTAKKHSFAQRAYAFVQRLLCYTYRSMQSGQWKNRDHESRADDFGQTPSNTHTAPIAVATNTPGTGLNVGLETFLGVVGEDVELDLRITDNFPTASLPESLWSFHVQSALNPLPRG